jgi:hypothetical protein
MFSRVYLGVHWLTDMLGSACLVLGTINFAAFFYHRQTLPTLPIKQILSFTVLFFLVMGSHTIYKHYHRWTDEKNLALTETQQMISLQQWWQGTNVLTIRENRFGKPVQVMNVQWLGTLDTIKQALLDQGWQVTPPRNMTMILSQITAKKGTYLLPIIPALYKNQAPALMLLNNKSQMGVPVVLCLWPAPYQIEAREDVLYFGTLNYLPAHKGLIPLGHARAPSYNSVIATKELEPYLGQFSWKVIPFSPQQLVSNEKIPANLPLSPILLVK